MVRILKKISDLWSKNYSFTFLLVILVFYLFTLIPQIRDGDSDKIFTGIFLYFLILAYIITKHIFNNKKIDIHKIIGAVVLYLLIGMIFAYIYSILDLMNPDSFIASVVEPFENYEAKSFYYSFVTLTTTGLGDVIPATSTARNFTVMGSLIGQLFPVILIACLVSIEIAHKTEKKL